MSNTLCDSHCQMTMVFMAHPSWAAVLVCPCTHGFVQAADQLWANCLIILAFHASMISLTSKKRSLKAGGCLAVIERTFRIASKSFLNMNWPNLMGAPTKQSTSPMDQKSVRSGPLIVAMRNHKPSQ